MNPCLPLLTRRRLFALLGSGAAFSALPAGAQAPGADWAPVEAAARGQTVHFNAWAGSEQINAYIQWVAGELQQRHGVKLRHVKISDAADVVKRVRAEKAAGRGAAEGTVDLVWINGENFAAMKREGLLGPPFAPSLPNFRYVDTVGKPTTLEDFSVPTDGLESPWGMAQLTFFADSRRLPQPLVWSVAWLETAPRRWNAALRPLLYLPLVTPAVLWVVGLYGAALWLRIEGRWSTVTTEAVSLAAGGQRSLTSAYAGLQFALPLLGFALAARVGRPRRFAPPPGAADGGTADPARARTKPVRAGVSGSTP